MIESKGTMSALEDAQETHRKAVEWEKRCREKVAWCVEVSLSQVACYGNVNDEAAASQRYRDVLALCDLAAAVVAFAAQRLRDAERVLGR